MQQNVKAPELSVRLPEAEEQVMLALWGCGGRAGFYDLQQALTGVRWAPSTLVNVLYRLEKRGFLGIEKQGLRNNVYTALVSRWDYLGTQSRLFLRRCWGGSLSAFCKEVLYTQSEEELDAVRDLLDREYSGRSESAGEGGDPWEGDS